MSTEEPRPDPLVDHLATLASREDRGALAALRSYFRGEGPWDALRVVLPFVGGRPEFRKRREDDALLLGALFALHPVSGSHSLARALRRVMHTRDSGSIEARFNALIASSREDLPNHLRHAITLIAADKIGIDWAGLHRDLRWTDHVRRRWARDFWGAAADPLAAETAD